MSSHTIEKEVIIFPSVTSKKEESINFREILIPFSKFGTPRNIIYIYDGNENIKFKKRHPVYQELLFDEFHTN
jgi:hypothetical protein